MFIPISIQSSFVNTRRTTLNTIPVPVCCALAQKSKIFHALVCTSGVLKLLSQLSTHVVTFARSLGSLAGETFR